MGAEPPRPLADAAAKRSLDAEHRVHSALRELDREGATVTFAAVAARARVSRAFLYAHADFRAEIEALRVALDDSQRQREEIVRLREELALAHGRVRVRELELDRRARRT